MKKFEFTLAKLKQYREQLLETEKNKLSFLHSERNKLNKELKDILKLLAEKTNELNEKMPKGINSAELIVSKRYISQKQQEIHQKRYHIALKEREIETQLGQVVLATQEVSKLEKLEENQIEEYKAEELKEQEKFIEEFVSNKEARKKI